MGDKLKVLVVGSGGREHALCWKIAQSARLSHLYCAPGNGGTASVPLSTNVPIKADDFEGLTAFCLKEKIDLVVIGPDNPLAEGIVDHLEEHGLLVFGPRKDEAKLEWSKAHAKQFMLAAGIPTARFAICSSLEEGQAAARQNDWARVVKADGLALGKGVFVCESEAQVQQALQSIFVERSFGTAGDTVILEERLCGEELSLLMLCDGKRLMPMPALQDHKRRFDGDRGPNTGGMGAYAPVELFQSARAEIEELVLGQLQKALKDGTLKFKGVLYAGLMVVKDENGKYVPYVLEFNARFGDPETQALLPLMRSDLLEALWSCAQGKLDQVKMEWSKQASCCVVAVAKTYPERSSSGEPITLGETGEDSVIFLAGASRDHQGGLITNGGRILCATAVAADMAAAQKGAYQALEHVSFSGMDYRKDIAKGAVKQCLSN